MLNHTYMDYSRICFPIFNVFLKPVLLAIEKRSREASNEKLHQNLSSVGTRTYTHTHTHTHKQVGVPKAVEGNIYHSLITPNTPRQIKSNFLLVNCPCPDVSLAWSYFIVPNSSECLKKNVC